MLGGPVMDRGGVKNIPATFHSIEESAFILFATVAEHLYI